MSVVLHRRRYVIMCYTRRAGVGWRSARSGAWLPRSTVLRRYVCWIVEVAESRWGGEKSEEVMGHVSFNLMAVVIWTTYAG